MANCGCCLDSVVCYSRNNVVRQANSFVCNDGTITYYQDTETKAAVSPSELVPCPDCPNPAAVSCGNAFAVYNAVGPNAGLFDTTYQGSASFLQSGHNVRIVESLTPGGPYTVRLTEGGLTQPGDCQPATVVDGAGTFSKQPSTTYYWRLEIVDAGDNLVLASSECQYTTPAIPPPAQIIVVNNIDSDPAIDPIVEDARQFIEDGFLGLPLLWNGDQQIHIDITIDGPSCGGLTIATGGPDILRASGDPLNPGDFTTYSGHVNICSAVFNTLTAAEKEATIRHEMLHALGLGVGPNWNQFLINPGTANAGWTGPTALAQYQAMPGGFPGAASIPVEFDAGPGSDDSHWDEGPTHASGQQCLDNELMSPIATGSGTFSTVSSGALIDLGYDYDVNHGTVFACGGA